MQVKPMFKQPPEVRLSKSETGTLIKAALIVGELEKTRPDLKLANVADHLMEVVDVLTEAVDALKPEAEAKPEAEKQ